MRVGGRAAGPKRGRLAAIGLLCLGSALLFAPPAAAEPAWLPSLALSAPGKDAIDGRVAMDGGGGTVAIWEREGATPFLNTVQVSTRSPGGAFSAPVDLASPAHDPGVAMTPSGEAVAHWWRSQGGTYVLQVSTRPSGGAFSAPVDVASVPSGASPPETRMAVSPAGAVALAWVERDRPDPTEEEEENEEEPRPVGLIKASVRSPGGSFSTPEVVSPFPLVIDRTAFGPAVAIDGSGNAIVVWAYGELPPSPPEEGEEPPERQIQAAFRAAGSGGFLAPEAVSEASVTVTTPDVAMDAAGNAVAVWTRVQGESVAIEAAARPPGIAGEFAPESLPEGLGGVGPQIEMSSDGVAVVVWTRSVEPLNQLRASTRPAGGAFSAPQNVNGAGEESGLLAPSLAVNAGGEAVLSWSGRSEGGTQVAKAALRQAGGSFGAPTEVSPPGSNFFHTDAAVAGTGDATVLWYRLSGADSIIEAAGYDADAPVIQGLSVPPTATVGEPVAVSMAPFDVWPLASAGFTFGDGGSAAGTSASHAYASPGTYLVTATATGAGGATVSASGTISIAPSYAFRIGKHRRNRRRGTVLLTVHVPGPGRVTVAGRLVKRRQRRASDAGPVRISVLARGRALRLLRKKGKARVRARVSFRPDGGDHAASRRVLVVLVKRVSGKKKRSRNRRARRHRAR